MFFSLPGLHHVPVSVRHGLVCRALWPPGKGRRGKRLDFHLKDPAGSPDTQKEINSIAASGSDVILAI